MSSTIDWFDCPKCGGEYTAYYEQDNTTCEIYHGCSKCDWQGGDCEQENEKVKMNKKILTT